MVDGEIVDVTPITVECLPRSLAVLAPPLQLPHEDPAEKLDGLPNLEVIEKHA
jgi:hypothetical protein